MLSNNNNAGFGQFPQVRMRRLRFNETIRNLLKETILTPNDLILPLFIHHGEKINKPITSMPGHYQLSLDNLTAEIKQLQQLSIPGVILFGIPEKKDAIGSDSYHKKGIIQQAILHIKEIAPEMLVISDVCFCEYTDHGHCGITTEKNGTAIVDNDETLKLLAKQAVSHAQAGADIVAPSGMMDGMVAAIREGLDKANYQHIPILSYAVKYSSALYGPFREAAQGAPQFGDRQSYQMNYANSNEALREAQLDVAEGADMLMVKPAHAYLDIIYKIKQQFPGYPLGAYHVSGEYAMIKAAVEKGWLNEEKAVMEILTGIKRAGADFIITYYAKQVAQWLNKK